MPTKILYLFILTFFILKSSKIVEIGIILICIEDLYGKNKKKTMLIYINFNADIFNFMKISTIKLTNRKSTNGIFFTLAVRFYHEKEAKCLQSEFLLLTSPTLLSWYFMPGFYCLALAKLLQAKLKPAKNIAKPNGLQKNITTSQIQIQGIITLFKV
jgi:hypothetical protein